MTGDEIIARLGLQPHPEGGHYREMFRAPDSPRGASTAIYFLLKAGERSHWHKVDAQAVVPRGVWQAARSLGRWTLVGCTVAPAFEFRHFELAPPGWEPA